MNPEDLFYQSVTSCPAGSSVTTLPYVIGTTTTTSSSKLDISLLIKMQIGIEVTEQEVVNALRIVYPERFLAV